ncbi:MAG: DNA-binding protein [Candidatus Berkiellales bacterium]
MTKPIKKPMTRKGKTKSRSIALKKKQQPKSISYQEYLIDSLKYPEEAAGYLNAALEGGDINVFLLALQNVVQAQGGISALASKTQKSRTSLYKSLSENGNPYLKSANELLLAMGMHFSVVPNDQRLSR